MHLFKEASSLQKYLIQLRNSHQSIGFVPTMGALHEGHIALIRASKEENDHTVCSIFVNPTQFNDPADLKKYPRTLELDIAMLLEAECDILYAPTVEDVYPKPIEESPELDLGYAGIVMEAAKRPGHYKGVIQVVHRFLNIVQPDVIYMGQKDYQQQLIIRKLLAAMHPTIRLSMVKTERSAQGIALSSRNALLNDTEFENALAISKVLKWFQGQLPSDHIDILQEKGFGMFREAGLQPEYLEIADAHSLEPLQQVEAGHEVVICAAAYSGTTRLIDNVLWPSSK